MLEGCGFCVANVAFPVGFGGPAASLICVMRIISIRQPWAALIVHGFKDVENRTWPTRYRGAVLIHASLRPDDISSDEIERRFGVCLEGELPLGGIVGM